MQYMGSKNRIAKQLLPIMRASRLPGQPWVEPFVGGANMIDKVEGRRIGNDTHEYLVALLTAIKSGYEPPSVIDRDLYYTIKANPENYPKELVGFVGFAGSFGGRWWGGYAANRRGDNYAAAGRRNLLRQAKALVDVEFVVGDYRDLKIPERSLIYCDPPYQGTTKYGGGFNHDIFWDWCRDKAREGHTVFVSEYSAPADFVCVQEVHHKTTLNKNTSEPRIERLFRNAAVPNP